MEVMPLLLRLLQFYQNMVHPPLCLKKFDVFTLFKVMAKKSSLLKKMKNQKFWTNQKKTPSGGLLEIKMVPLAWCQEYTQKSQKIIFQVIKNYCILIFKKNLIQLHLFQNTGKSRLGRGFTNIARLAKMLKMSSLPPVKAILSFDPVKVQKMLEIFQFRLGGDRKQNISELGKRRENI